MATRSLMLASVLVLACSAKVDETSKSPASEEPPITRTPPAAEIDIPKSAYPGHGFVVHEWGTLTSVVGSDGSTQPGLHHEEEDLPAFVADRMKQTELRGGAMTVDAKMETPVTYFYSDDARTVKARVGFPTGVFTQWYPFVQTMAPAVLKLADGLHDRTMESAEVIPSACRPMWSTPFQHGLLDWGNVEILKGDVELPGPLGKTTWGFARNVAANPIRVQGQGEKFLFYRGLGTYDYPLHVTVEGQSVRLTDSIAEPLRSVFLMNVTREGAGFTEVPDVSSMTTATIPGANLTHARFVAMLKAKLAVNLVNDGLFTDEALAMVDTWERSYFLTPGVRILYLLPQSKTDALIPLTIEPKPDVTKRTMVIRVEVMTPEQEKQLSGWLHDLAAGDANAKSKILSLGRFAEPHLTRVLGLITVPAERAAAEALLTEIRKKQRWAPTAAE
jgi:hypothetical protein